MVYVKIIKLTQMKFKMKHKSQIILKANHNKS